VSLAVHPRPVHYRTIAVDSLALTPTTPPIPVRAQLTPRQPLLYAVLSLSGGILLGTRIWRPPVWWVVAILIFLAAGAFLVRRRLYWAMVLACGGLVLLGAFVVQARGPAAVNTEILRFANGNEVRLTAHVTSDGFRR